ncbi:hypothetical protein KEM55_005304 [Ascosphaera atra]|nr:hypothetical protein KEM55_005304 [Ascosphaera atra]
MWWSDWKLSMRQLLTNARFLGRGGLDVHRYTIWKEVQDKAATETWTDRRGYYFCQTVAVMPGQQGKGIGKMLLKAVMDRADQEGFHCYLESTRYTPNVEIYKKHGFKVIKEITCKDASDACTIWCMVRDPQDPK